MNGRPEELRRAVRSINVAMRKMRGRQTHTKEGLSFAQFGLLFALEGGQVLSARELGEAAELSPASVTQMLEVLENSGLVERTRSSEDKRVVLTRLSPSGELALEKIQSYLDARWGEMLADFSEDEIRIATSVLDRLVQHFNEIAEMPAETHDQIAREVVGVN